MATQLGEEEKSDGSPGPRVSAAVLEALCSAGEAGPREPLGAQDSSRPAWREGPHRGTRG